jgi:hypothetical protein
MSPELAEAFIHDAAALDDGSYRTGGRVSEASPRRGYRP